MLFVSILYFTNAAAGIFETSFSFYDINIAETNIADALDQLAEQSNTVLLYPYNDMQKQAANAVVGRYTIKQALFVLLSGSGYTGTVLKSGVIKIMPSITNSSHNITDTQIAQTDDLEESESENSDGVEVIKVTGITWGIKRSLIKKQHSDLIIDDISNEDIGKFPDQNIAEALQRISGISIDRVDGEGQFLTVRGFGPEFNSVLYNNRVLATENYGREFSFDILSDDIIRDATVYKSTSADMFTGGIGSVVNLSSTKPFDYAGFQAIASANYTHDTLSQKSFPEIASLLSYSNDKFGALFSFNFQERQYQTESAFTDGWLLADLSYVNNHSSIDDLSAVRIPINFDLRLENGKKTRLGGTAVFQYQFSNNLFATFDLLYSKYNVESHISSAANWTNYLDESFDNVTVDSNHTLLSYQYKSELQLPADFVELSHNRPTSTNQIGINLKWEPTERLNLEFDSAYSISKNSDGGNDRFIIVCAPNANPNYHLFPAANYPRITYDNPISVSDLRTHGVTYEGDDIKDAIGQFQLNGQLQLDFDYIKTLSFGLYQSNRTKDKSTYKTPWGLQFAGYLLDIPDEYFHQVATAGFLDNHQSFTLFSFDSNDYVNYLWSDVNIENYINSIEPTLSGPREFRDKYGGFEPVLQQNGSWKVKEYLKDAYVKLDLSSYLLSLEWSGNIGLRFSSTTIHSYGISQDIIGIQNNSNDPTNLTLLLADPIPVSAQNNYFNVLPSLNLKVDLNGEQIVRLGLSKTITRPNLNDLLITLSDYNTRVGANTAARGNPYLKPYQSDNLDLSWSWYYKDTGYVGFELFFKQISNFISESTETEMLFDHPEGTFLVTQPKNIGRAGIKGYEIAFFNKFVNLPNPFDGIGIQANYTYVNSDDNFDPINNPGAFALEGLSNSYNVIFIYEKNQIEARVSFNHREKFLVKSIGAQGQPEMVDAYGQLDANVSYHYNDKVTLVFEGTNILNENFRSYSIYKERLLKYSDSGTRYSIGMEYKF